MTGEIKVGIIGGTGQLGSAIATAWLESGCVEPRQLWISNRSGTAAGFESWPEITFTASNQLLADGCDVILLSVPPALVDTVRISAPGKLILSVMAGVSRERLKALTGSEKVVRAMSSPAAGKQLAYSPGVRLRRFRRKTGTSSSRCCRPVARVMKSRTNSRSRSSPP